MPTFPMSNYWLSRCAAWLRNAGPLAAIVLLVPGGSVIALLILALRQRPALSSFLLRAVGIGLLAGAPLALADPVAVALRGASPSTVEHNCAASDAEHARSLGDALFERGAYQSAGDCYAVAGDYSRANRAYLKAAGPERLTAARDFAETRDTARAQLQRIQHNLHPSR